MCKMAKTLRRGLDMVDWATIRINDSKTLICTIYTKIIYKKYYSTKITLTLLFSVAINSLEIDLINFEPV